MKEKEQMISHNPTNNPVVMKSMPINSYKDEEKQVPFTILKGWLLS